MGFIVWLLVSFTTAWATTDRSSCFQYIECYENAQAMLKDCAGGTGVALVLESKDKTLSELFTGRSQVISGCQDHLTKEIIDFDALQVLVTQDARECFEKLPETTQQVDAKSGVCEYSPIPSRDHYGKEQYECVVEYLADRQKCETLLNCCPDHSRCGERVNAVSLAYQQGTAKSVQIVSNLLSCVVSRDPSAHDLVSKLRRQRSAVRNAGLPFLKPDLATEERIARRLSLTSTVTVSERQQKFVQKYNEIREVLAKRIETAELAKTPKSTSQISEERRVSIIKNLLKDADDQELAIYVSLISEGNFEKLSELEKQKLLKIEDESGAEHAIEKIGIIKNAIKKALSNKEKKTIEYAIKAQVPQEAVQQLEEENIWNDRKEKDAVNEVLGEVLENVDSDILFRAKKFASAVGEAIEAQKELILTQDNTFNGNGLSQQRTSTAAEVPEGGKVHDFETLKDKTNEASPALKQATLTLKNIQPLTQARRVSSVQKPIETIAVEEGSGDGEVEGSGTDEEVKPKPEIESAVLIQDELILNRKQNETEEEGVNDDKELAKRDNKSGSSSESESSESREQHKKHKKSRHHKKHHHNKGGKNRSGDDSKEVTTSTAETTTAAQTQTTTNDVTSRVETTTTSPVTSTETSSTTSALETTTQDGEIQIPSNNRAPREDESILTEENHENKRNIEEIVQDINKDREEFREKLNNLKMKLAKIDAVYQDDKNIEPKVKVSTDGESSITTIGSTMTEELTGKTVHVDASTGSESTTPAQTLPHFCSQYARCDDLSHEFENRCHQQFSEGVRTHGIEELEIVNILTNNSVSKHEVVIKACLHPLDKNAYTTLRQLLHVERGVRRACLDLGRNRGRLSGDDLTQCQNPQTSTENVESFLNDNHIRSDDNLLTCLAQVEAFRDSCNNISRCCASIKPCDKYIKQSPIQDLKKEAIGILVQRQSACEDRMMETLKYIHDNLTSRRRRFYRN